MLIFTVLKTAFNKKNLYFLLPLSLCLIAAFVYYFSFVKLKPNDLIITTSDGTALFSNENPTFKVDFGSKENPQGQIIRFEAQASNENPFEKEEKKSIFTKIAELFKPRQRVGIQMSLVGIDFSETEKTGDVVLADNVQTVAEILGTDRVETSTNLVDMGRKIGEYDTEEAISKQTVVNSNVADGIDLEYQILEGLGLKEEIVINDLEAYSDSCGDNCSLPLNKFEFDLTVDDGVVLKKGWFTIEGQSSEIYYFVDGDGRYLAHFLPSYAIDAVGDKTYEVGLDIQEYSVGRFKATVTVDSNWLLSSDRVYPIRIDPSIVHDDTSDFSGGIFNGVESITGPKVQVDPGSNCTGGTITTSNGYIIHTFTSSGTFTCSRSIRAEVLVVGGGGGGGSATSGQGGGGGGAGGFLTKVLTLSSGSKTVTVGAGGTQNNNGGNSVFDTLTAIGGGAGGASGGDAGSVGGSGGGGGYNGAGGSGTSGQGTAGGAGSSVGHGGGGGGAGQAGAVGYDTGTGKGGDGLTSDISGTSTYYAGGGSGGYGVYPGGLGGGGQGSTGGVGGNGTNGLGGGGGGAYHTYGAAGTGGSGVVIVKYRASFFGTYTSPSLDMGTNLGTTTLSWISSGIATGDGETPYSTTGLVAQWNFNETSGTTAVSGGTCGTSCNGTLTNMTTSGQDAGVMTGWTANNRRWGAGAVMFDGTNDYVEIGDQLDMGTSDFSVSAWIKTQNTSTSSQFVISKALYGSTAGRWWVGTNTGKVRCGFEFSTGSVGLDSLEEVADGNWHNIVCAFDRDGNLTISIDGEVDGSISISAGASDNLQNTLPLRIGAYNNTDSSAMLFFEGVIDSVQVYSRALSADEILSNYQSGNIEFQYRVSTDGNTWSDWLSDGVSTSDLSWNTLDNSYLYSTSDANLISYWPMDESTGSTVADVRGTSPGTASGTTIVSGKYGNGKKFNGTSDYIESPDNDFLDLTNNYTLEAWVYRSADSGTYERILSKSATDGYDYWMQISTTDTLMCGIMSSEGGSYYSNSTATISLGAWYQVGCSLSASNVWTLYINGQVVSSSGAGTAAPARVTTRTFEIGRLGSGSAWSYSLNGVIDEVRVFNTTLSAAQIQSNYLQGLNTLGVYQQKSGGGVIKNEGTNSDRITSSLGNGLVAYWKLDESSGTSLVDSVGSNTGTATGTTVVTGKYSNARSFNGSSDSISVTNSSSLQITGSQTIEMWLYPTSFASRRNPYAKAYGGEGTITQETDGTLTYYYGTAGANATPYQGFRSTLALNLNRWNHVAIVRDLSAMSLSWYINGVFSNTVAASYAAAVASTLNLTIGSGYAGYYAGLIDEAKVYNIAKTAAEVFEEYNATSTYYTNYSLDSNDVSTESTVSFDIAGDKVGSYASAILGESAYANYEPDTNTVGSWDFNGPALSKAYQDRTINQNNGVMTYYGIEYGIRSTNATFIINQYGGASNAGEMDITCTGGDAACVIVTKDGTTLSTPTINSGVAMVDGTTGTNWLMYSPSLTAQGITPYSSGSNNYIAVYYTGSAWQYDNNSAYVTFTPQPYNILVCIITRFTATTPLDIYPIVTEGKTGNGMSFDGVNDRIAQASGSNANIAGDITIEAWIKMSTFATVALVSKYSQYSLVITSGGLVTWADSSNWSYANFGYPDIGLVTGQWQHIAATKTGSTVNIYLNGDLRFTQTFGSAITGTSNIMHIGCYSTATTCTTYYYNGLMDDVRISNTVRTADQIRQAYEVGLRTHDVFVNFGASLNSGNLISSSSDTSFTVDATTQGLPQMGSNLYVGEKVIVREVSSGSEYIAQGTVSGITASTGATTVSSWDSGSTFPSGGFTTKASVFKWQTEYISVKNKTIGTQMDAISLLTLRLTGAFSGRNVWIDNLRTSDGYLTNSSGEELTFPYYAQYLQYKAIITSQDAAVTPYISQVQLDYESGAPTLDQIMRHGKWFSSGVKKNFWWTGN